MNDVRPGNMTSASVLSSICLSVVFFSLFVAQNELFKHKDNMESQERNHT